MAASVATLLLGGTVGWFGASWNADQVMSANAFADAFPERALDAHIVFASDIRHPVEVGAADPAHLRTWLEKRVGAEFGVPDLSSKGYTLIGGRLLAEGDKPAGLLMYEDASTKQRLSIYFAKNDRLDNSPMRFSYRGKLMTCFWTEPDLVYALAGEQSKEQMLPLAELAHDGFERGEG
jgi:anti-sigma factor RsiW